MTKGALHFVWNNHCLQSLDSIKHVSPSDILGCGSYPYFRSGLYKVIVFSTVLSLLECHSRLRYEINAIISSSQCTGCLKNCNHFPASPVHAFLGKIHDFILRSFLSKILQKS